MVARTKKDVQDKVKWLTDMVKERDEEIEQLEKRLENSLDASRKSDEEHLKEKQAWKDERLGLLAKIKGLEEDVKHERRRASQALDVAESTSDAAGGIGRLLRQLVENDVMETVRLEHDRRQREHQESMRHRRPV